MKKNIINTLIMSLFLICGSCERFLDEKPDQKLQIPSNLTDMQSLLDYYHRVGTYEPHSIEVCADDYYLTDEAWRGLAQENHRRLYLWSESNVFPPNFNDWSYAYDNIYVANTVLADIDRAPVNNELERQNRDNIKGQAFALRGRRFMKLAFIWSPVYSAENELSPYGIPLKLDIDFNYAVQRATVGASYRHAESDLLQAVRLLPERQVHPMRTSRSGAYGLLSRLYLVMGDYANAYAYADSCLQLHNVLLDYNELNKGATFPFAAYHAEVALHTQMLTPAMLAYTVGSIDTTLYHSYREGDLRKQLYFKVDNAGEVRYYGSYSGTYQLFDGIATDEMLLNRAEAAIRLGRVTQGIQDLNTLLATRWEKDMFVPFSVTDQNAALSLVLEERRKSLLMRGIRWTDLKRLNRDGAGIVVERMIAGERYVLLPNDPKYALPIPEQVITESGVDQNPR